jgi:hypothetical protein
MHKLTIGATPNDTRSAIHLCASAGIGASTLTKSLAPVINVVLILGLHSQFITLLPPLRNLGASAFVVSVVPALRATIHVFLSFLKGYTLFSHRSEEKSSGKCQVNVKPSLGL